MFSDNLYLIRNKEGICNLTGSCCYLPTLRIRGLGCQMSLNHLEAKGGNTRRVLCFHRMGFLRVIGLLQI